MARDQAREPCLAVRGRGAVRLQKRSTKACLTSGAMREASPHTNTSASFCKKLATLRRRSPRSPAGHMSSACRARGRRRTRVRDPRRLERAHLVLVQEVLPRIAAPKKRSESPIGAPCFLSAGARGRKPRNGATPCRPDHDHRHVGVVGRVERRSSACG